MSRYIDADRFKDTIEGASEKMHLICGVKGVDIGAVIKAVDMFPTADVVEIPEGGIGNLSDGYHTFNELYHHRAILFSVICNAMPDKAWKSKLHDTGDMFDGMFIVGIETPEGQATYHYDIEQYWDMFKVKELEKAPKWDGHTPQEAIDRISKLTADVVEIRHGTWYHGTEYGAVYAKCSACGRKMNYYCYGYAYCALCGAKMDGGRSENGK